jgi:hypothetical protein
VTYSQQFSPPYAKWYRLKKWLLILLHNSRILNSLLILTAILYDYHYSILENSRISLKEAITRTYHFLSKPSFIAINLYVCYTTHADKNYTWIAVCRRKHRDFMSNAARVVAHWRASCVCVCVLCVCVCVCCVCVCVCVSPAHLWLGEHCCLLPTTRL